MSDSKEKILVWLPSPMGDAVLCTSTLRAIRNRFKNAHITFYGNSIVQQILSPSQFNNDWLDASNKFFDIVKTIKKGGFSKVVLFKNSFRAAFICFLASVPVRIGYARQGRSAFLTDKLYPEKLSGNKFKPLPMVSYYMKIAEHLGCDTSDTMLELTVNDDDKDKLLNKFPEIAKTENPLIILVPGGAFGPSKCWNPKSFAQTADMLIEKYDAQIIVSVAPQEKQIAEAICSLTKNKLFNLGDHSISLGQLKAMFSLADLVITNDTGPRHIAIALNRKLITMFGPNDPEWTETGYEDEIKIVGQADCAPCAKHVCTQDQHYCMDSITPEIVFDEAEEILKK